MQFFGVFFLFTALHLFKVFTFKADLCESMHAKGHFVVQMNNRPSIKKATVWIIWLFLLA